MTNAEAVAATNQRQTQQFRIPLNAPEHFGIGNLQVLEPRIDPGFAFGVEQCRQAEALREPPDFRRGHRLLRQIDEVNLHAAFFEEAFGGAGRLRVLYTEDLKVAQLRL